jgi:hypothetical protein
MKKILLVFNGETYNKRLADFALQMNKISGALLEAVFVSPFVQQMNQYPFPGNYPEWQKVLQS